MTFSALIETVRGRFSKADVSDIEGTLAFQFNITGEAAGVFYVEVKEGALSIEPYDYHDRNAAFTLSDKDFLLLLSGKLNPVEAFGQGTLKVDGDLGQALRITRFL